LESYSLLAELESMTSHSQSIQEVTPMPGMTLLKTAFYTMSYPVVKEVTPPPGTSLLKIAPKKTIPLQQRQPAQSQLLQRKPLALFPKTKENKENKQTNREVIVVAAKPLKRKRKNSQLPESKLWPSGVKAKVFDNWSVDRNVAEPASSAAKMSTKSKSPKKDLLAQAVFELSLDMPMF
jgi:hypothetical protein